MEPTESVAARRCARKFTILADGGVLSTWACGASRVFADEIAIDVEVLADHLPTSHHHHGHLPQHLPHFSHKGANR